MVYTKTTWVNGSPPYINDTNLNKIEQGIADAIERQVLLSKGDLITATSASNPSRLGVGIGFLRADTTTTTGLRWATIDGTDIATGVIPPARLGSGTPDSTKFLRGDGTWQVVTGGTGGGGSSTLSGLTDTSITTPVSGQILRYNGTSWANAAFAKADVGLGNVDNTSDATKWAALATITNKSISGSSNTLSNIPQAAITNLSTTLAGKANTVHTHDAADIDSSNGGLLSIGVQPPGAPIFVDKAQDDYGAAGVWPTSRPTTRDNVKIIWMGDTDPGALALDRDIWYQTVS